MTNEEILKQALEKVWFDLPIEDRMLGLDDKVISNRAYFRIIFSHDFAKAFFGPKWIERIRDMVLEADPLKYLERFL